MDYDSTANEYLRMVNPIGWRRDLDIRPLAIFAGLSRQHLLEVYDAYPRQFATSIESAQRIHDTISISTSAESTSIESLKHYSGDGFKEINDGLWNKYVHGVDLHPSISTHIENIKSLLNKSTTEPVTLFTGVKISPATLAGIEWNSSRPKKLITFPSFTSTTTNSDVAQSFCALDTISHHHESDHHGVIETGARHVLQLEFPLGLHHAASMVDHSQSPHEEEVLLHPGHSFELHPRPTRVKNMLGNVYFWKAVAHNEMFPPMMRNLKTK